MTSDEWMTRAEAAARLGVSLETVGRYVRDGRIERRKNSITRAVGLRRTDVERVRIEREGTEE